MFTARDVVSNLKENEINSSQDFSWISQLRYYFENEAMKTTNLSQVTDKLYHIMLYRIHLVMSEI
jgi:hypothetical protein